MKTDEAVKLLSNQRHQFLNYLQVIRGYLELGKPQKAYEYLREAVEEIQAQGELFRIYQPELTLLLYTLALRAQERGVTVKYREAGPHREAQGLPGQGYSAARLDEVLSGLAATCRGKTVEVSVSVAGDKVRLWFSGEDGRTWEYTVAGSDMDVR